MKFVTLFVTFLLMHLALSAQIDATHLLGLINATSAEMAAIASPIKGSLIYNTTDSAIYQYNGVSWDIVGQTGPAGPPGPQGPQGIPGDPATDDQTLSLSGNDLSISGGNTISLTPLIDTNLASDDLAQDPETRIYDMNSQDLGFTNGKMGIGTSTPNSALQISGSISAPIRTTTVNTTLGIDDFTLITTVKDLIITLPAANSCTGRIYVIKNYSDGDNDTNISYLKANGDPETKIDKDRTTWLQSDGANWQLINQL